MKSKAWICLFLSAALLLAACTAAPNRDSSSEPEQAAVQTAAGETAKVAVPQGYRGVLEEFFAMVSSIREDCFEEERSAGRYAAPTSALDYEWSCMIAELNYDIRSDSDQTFGFALRDINADGTPELFLLRSDLWIEALFTLAGDTPQAVDAFWSRSCAVLLESGELYTYGSGGADTFVYSVQRLSDTGEWQDILQFGCDAGEYYRLTDGKKEAISEEDFLAQKALYPVPADYRTVNKDSGLIFQGEDRF